VLPPIFGIMFDGWSSGNTHYIAIFAVFSFERKAVHILLAFSPPLDEESYTADAHYELLKMTVYIYGLVETAILFLVGISEYLTK
jgi:hypothetical protein